MSVVDDLIERAVLSERERCARIADAEQITYDVERYNEMNGYNASRQIAAAIRLGPKASVGQSELQPCPLCRGPAYYTETVNGTSMAYVGCAACGISMKAALTPGPGPHQTQWSRDIRAVWNTRVASAQLSVTREIAMELVAVLEELSLGLKISVSGSVGYQHAEGVIETKVFERYREALARARAAGLLECE